MSAAIPFVNSESDAKIAAQSFAKAPLFKVPLWNAKSLVPHLPHGASLWLDLAVDGYPEFDATSKWATYMSEFDAHAQLSDPSFLSSPTAAVIDSAVRDLVSKALEFQPAAVSVPQLAHRDDVLHNAINRQLAASFGKLAGELVLPGLRILPAIFTHQNQVTLKTARNKKLAAINACLQRSGANGIWAVDGSLADQTGTATFENKRFPGLIDLHSELAELAQLKIHVAGPYWGMNLVLWARGLATHPAAALGSGFQYYRSGQRATTPTPKVALGPLRRWSRATSDFWNWLDGVIQRLEPSDPARQQFDFLRQSRARLEFSAPDAKAQVAQFYSWWVDAIAQHPPANRALLLFQDLSSAHVLGSRLPEIPSETGRARQANMVARQLMMNCL